MSVSRTVFYCLFEKYVTPDNWNNLVKREKPSNHNYCLGTLAGATAWMPDASCPCSRAMHPAAPRNSVCPSCTLLMCSCKTRRGGQAQRARGSRHATAALVNEFDFFFLAKKESILAHNSNISTENFVLETSSGFLQKVKAFSEESHHFPPPKHGKTVSTASSYGELTSAPLADQNLTWCMETNGAFKPREHLVYKIFFLFVHVCAPGNVCIWVHKCMRMCMCVCSYLL